MKPLDSQVIELIGRHHLMDELLRAGLEVASPVRDRGIDLIAYADKGSDLSVFSAVPIQMKAASRQSFSISKKYEDFRGLLIAHVWNLESPQDTATFALTYRESLAIADEMGWTATASWATGTYSNTQPGAKLQKLLEPFRMTPQRWRERIIGSQPTGHD